MELAFKRGTYTVVIVDSETGVESYRGPGFGVPEVLRTLNTDGLVPRDRAILEPLMVLPNARTIHMWRDASTDHQPTQGYISVGGYPVDHAPKDISEGDVARLVTRGWIRACVNQDFYELTEVGKKVLRS